MERKTNSRFQKKNGHEERIAGSTLPSRAEYHGKKRKSKGRQGRGEKKTKISVPLVLLFILLMLPVGIITFISIGGPSKANPAANSSGEEVSFETDDSFPEEPAVIAEEDKPKNEVKKKEVKKKEEPKKEESRESARDEAEKKESVAEPSSPETESVENSSAEEEQEQDEQAGQAAEGTVVYHTVKPGETLFRIAMNYYQSQDGIDKIRQANGLANNEISVGQTLKIPKP